MKKITAFLTAFALITSVGCSMGGTKSSDTVKEISSVSISQTLYKEKEIPLKIDDLLHITAMRPCGDSCCIFYETEKYGLKLAKLNSDLGLEGTYDICNTHGLGCAVMYNSDGSFTTASCDSDFILEFDDEGRCTNFEEFAKNGNISFRLTHFDSSGSKIGETPITGLERAFDAEYSSMCDLIPYGDGGYLLRFYNGIAFIGSDGSVEDTDVDTKYNTYRFTQTASGEVMAVEEFSGTYSYMDGKTLRLSEDTVRRNIYDAFPAENTDGGFKIYYRNDKGICGLTVDDEEVVIVDIGGSLIDSTEAKFFTPCGDGRFIMSAGGSDLRLYERRPDDYVENRKPIIIANVGGSLWTDQKNLEFLRANDEYSFEYMPFAEFEDIKNSILKGESPDLVMGLSIGEINRLANLGGVADLYKFMEKNDGLKREEMLPNVLNALEYKGGLYGLCSEFGVVGLFADSSFIGEENRKWTQSDFLRIWKERPEGMMPLYINNSENPLYALRTLMSPLSLWDKKSTKYRYDSDEAAELFKICGEFYMESGKLPSLDYAENSSVNEQMTALKERKAMLGDMGNTWSVSSLLMELAMNGLTFDEASLLYLPNLNGEGSVVPAHPVAILETGSNKEGAWKYLSFIFSEEYIMRYPESLDKNYVNKNCFEAYIENVTQKGDAPEMGKVTDQNGNVFEYPSKLTKEQAERYREFVLGCTTLDDTTDDMRNICGEEFLRYINGEVSAKECGKNINSRLEIKLAEEG